MAGPQTMVPMVPGRHEKQLNMSQVFLGRCNKEFEPRVFAALPCSDGYINPQTCFGAGSELDYAEVRELVLRWAESPHVIFASMSSEELSEMCADDQIWIGFRHTLG